MHIDTLYCSTYGPNIPITGHMQVKTETGNVKIDFDADECTRIQDIAVEAYKRSVTSIIEDLSSKTPALVALPSPEPEGEYTNFEEISSLDIPF